MSELALNKNAVVTGVETNSTHGFQRKEKDNSNYATSDYFSERAKKLATAVYIVTNLIPQTDPLRLTIRRFSIKLLSFMGMSQSGHTPEEISVATGDLCKKIVEMLEIAFFSGYISEMNFSVLKSEFDLFINEIAGFEGSQKTISPNSLKAGSSQNEMSFNVGTEIIKGQKTNYTPSTRAFSTSSKPTSKSKTNDKKSTPNRSVVEAKKVSRKEAIISIIKMKGSVGIKDISSVVINCSEKTVQRELMSLVASGVLKKSGDRRWSVYSLSR